MSTVIVIDKFPLIRMGMHLLLDEHFSRLNIISVSHIDELSEDAEADLFILGIDDEPQSNGLLMVAQLKSRFIGSKLIVSGESALPETTVGYMKAGVKGYISKQSSIDEYSKCIKSVLKGGMYIPPDHFDILFKTMMEDIDPTE